jgi:hypothetical protein
MSAVIWSLQRAVVMRARIPTWLSAPTEMQTYCPARQTERLLAGTRLSRSGLSRVFVSAWWSLQLHALCAIHTDSRRPALASCAETRLVCGVFPAGTKKKGGYALKLPNLENFGGFLKKVPEATILDLRRGLIGEGGNERSVQGVSRKT